MTFAPRSLSAATVLAAVTAITTVTAATSAHAQPNPTLRMVHTALKLQALEGTGFKTAPAEQVKALRAEYQAAATAAQAQARSRAAQLSAGKKPAEVDQALREADKRAGTPAQVVATIERMGGPYQALQQVDTVFAEFNREVLSGSQKFAWQPSAERLLMLALGVGDVQARTIMKAGKTRCYFLMWASGQSEQTAYDNCG